MRLALVITAAVTGMAASTAEAQTADRPERFYIRVGPGFVDFDEDAKVKIAGQPLAGANGTLSDNVTAGVELGYFITPDISVAATVGVPPTTKLTAAGTLAGAGTLGKVTYGPGVYTARYHFGRPRGVRPYIGGGFSWTIIFGTKDGVLQDVKVENATGPAVTWGIDVPINRKFGLFASGIKTWTSANSRFTLPTPGGSAPGTARLQLNPLILYGGIQYRF
ncbi:hypothetical protein WSK_1731 [Novosphingobium sp. Rr 2-17]|uniref:OmpW/AlkL family protein n=1 Tax=Novosphingobium sp. Rr 2-17 TaxID=555793 RepID=UPI000269A4EB|nr:OmpW family outer membrane protein [Novosphingobium sp. Rr 2-17]EIZ79651.1 hypothetical protein WSK_1731 [Novosphingobium sp. Rr 2-17]